MFEEDRRKSYFPKGFLWGASTASHQVEGYNHNQWSVWELQNARQLAQNADKEPKGGILLSELENWPEIRAQAKDPANYISGKAVEHYLRYREDFDIAKKLNLNSFRFTLEWSRIEPKEGVWDEAAIEHYKTYIKELNKRHLEPLLNIWHWTLPVWFADMGGFKYSHNLRYFKRFVKKVAQEFAGDVNYIITINEPNVYASFSYATGEWPPGEQNPWSMVRVYRNLVKAHKYAYRILKRANPHLMVGIAGQLANIQAKRPHNFGDEFITEFMRYGWNWWFINQIMRNQDFVGFNYYFGDYYKGLKRDNPKFPLNDLGWYMEPEGLYPLLLRVWQHYKKPIIITENGVADSKDQYREWWLEETIIAMEKALSEGVDLRGYFHWSLLDNFEWATGWWPKFGLVEVDRKNDMKRKIRPSAKWLANKINELS